VKQATVSDRDNRPWFAVVGSHEPIEQGDFVNECPIYEPYESTAEGSNGPPRFKERCYDVVILSQSCDIDPEHPKVDVVLVSPFWPLAEFANREGGFFKKAEGKESIRRGYSPGYHMLNKCDLQGFETEILVIDFHNVFGIPYQLLTELVISRGDRLRVLPPYREHLSQAFARFFMRVGLPVDIPPFK